MWKHSETCTAATSGRHFIEFNSCSVSRFGRCCVLAVPWDHGQQCIFLFLEITSATCAGYRDPKIHYGWQPSSTPHDSRSESGYGQWPCHQFRPTHSPDFSPVELCFADIKAFIKTNAALITPTTLVEWVTHAVNNLKASNIRKYCAHSHYLVTGEDYKPYNGWQWLHFTNKWSSIQ